MNDLAQTAAAPPAAAELMTPNQRSLPELTDLILAAHKEVMRALSHGAGAAIAAGKALITAKALLKKQRGHGSWQDYIAIECRLGVRTAQIYMYLAKHEDLLRQLVAANAQPNAFLSQAQALKLLSVARSRRRRRRPPNAAT